MTFPFELFCDKNLGKTDTENNLVNALSTQPINAAGTMISINATNGNTVVQDKAFVIRDAGIDISIGMIWNAADNQFRIAHPPTIKQETKYFVMAGDIIFTNPDGKEIRFIYSSQDKGYVSEQIGADGLSIISLLNPGYERYIPATGIKETYDAQGRLTTTFYPPGKTVQYSYANDGLSITLPTGRKIEYLTDTENTNTHHLWLNDNKESVKLANYELSQDNTKLTSSVIQPDGSAYQTTYTRADNNLIIKSDDNTHTEIHLNQQQEIQTITQGDDKNTQKIWHFNLKKNDRCLEVTDKAGQPITTIWHDENNYLAKQQHAGNAEAIYYHSNPAGQLLEFGLDDGHREAIQKYTYDPSTGLVQSSILIDYDSAKNLTRSTTYYQGDIAALKGVKIAETTTQQNNTLTTYYVYNDLRQLCYLITPEGRVTKFSYATEPYYQCISKQSVTSQSYKTDTCDPDQPLTYPRLVNLDAWWESTLSEVDRKQINRIDYEYDAYFRQSGTIQYAKVDEQGEGIINECTHYENIALDNRGRPEKTQTATSWNKDRGFSFHRQVTYFDGLDRIITSLKGAEQSDQKQQQIKIKYDGNTITKSYSNGLIEIIESDASGEIIDSCRTDSTQQQSRSEKITYANNHRLKLITREDGLKEYHYYNAVGKLLYTILPGGDITGYQYDPLGRLTHTNQLSHTKRFDEHTDINDFIYTCRLLSQQINLYKYNGELLYHIAVKTTQDSEGKEKKLGFVTEYKYELGKLIQEIQYDRPLANNALNTLTYQQMRTDFLDDNRHDRVTNYYYDKDGNQIGKQTLGSVSDGGENKLGYLREFRRDEGGRLIQELIYKQLSLFSTALEKARPQNSEALCYLHWYDNAGRKTATLDPDNQLTLFDYYCDGKLKKQTRLFHRQIFDKNERTLELATILQNAQRDEVIEYDYDEQGRLCTTINHRTGLQTVSDYDDNDNEIKQTKQDISNDSKTPPRTWRKSYNVFDELEREASERLYATHGDHDEIWTRYDLHPDNGLRLSKMDGEGNKTLFFYDEAKRLSLEISPTGAITTYQYDTPSHKATRIRRLYHALNSSLLEELTDDKRDGFINDKLLSLLPYADEKDDCISRIYDTDDLLIHETNNNGTEQTYQYNRFKEIENERLTLAQDRCLETQYSHDLAGHQIESIRDPNGLYITTRAEFNDPLGRITQRIDELGHEIQINHQGLRKEIHYDTTTKATKTIEHDSFMRPSLETDWGNQSTIEHSYEESNRTHTQIDSLGQQKIETYNAYNEIEKITEGERITSTIYGVDGQIERVTYPDGSKESYVYNTLGWKLSKTDKDGTIEEYQHNSAGQLIGTKILEHTTHYKPNNLGVNEEIISPQGVKKVIIENAKNRQQTIITDPDELNIIQDQKIDKIDGSITKTTRDGNNPDEVLHKEIIRPDVLNREHDRHVDLGNDKTLLLGRFSYDNKGHITQEEDATGVIKTNIYDVAGNLGYSIDAEGFATEQNFDLNHRLICVTTYADKLADIATQENIQALLAPLRKADIKQQIYDAVGHERFTLNWIQTNKQTYAAKVAERQYNSHGELITEIEYANLLPAHPHCNPDTIINYDQAQTLIQDAHFIIHDHDRITTYGRDQMGRIVFKKNAEGYIVENRYDIKGKVIAIIAYAEKYETIDLQKKSGDIRSALNINHPKNRIRYFTHDHFGNLITEIDSESFLTVNEYDKDNHLCHQVRFSKKINDFISPKYWIRLQELLLKDGADRDIQAVSEQINAIIKAEQPTSFKDLDLDVHTSHFYDMAGRKIVEMDSLYKKQNELNALGLPIKQLDKLGHEWSFAYDKAKRLIAEFSPPVDLTSVSIASDTAQLTITTQEQIRVKTAYEYGDSFKPQTTTYADNIDGDRRSIKSIYNKNKQLIGTEIHHVTIDDGSDNKPAENQRPECKVTLSTQRILDYAGRELVNIDVAGIARFTLYDGLGRKRYLIDGDGYVTEFNYQHTFNEETSIQRYEEPIPLDALLPFRETGLTANQLDEIFSFVRYKDNRCISIEHDRRGLIVETKKDEITIAITNSHGEIESTEASPHTIKQYNAFGEITHQYQLTPESQSIVGSRFDYDNNGNQILSLSPGGYVIAKSFGMMDNRPDKTGGVLLKKIEYAQPIADFQQKSVEEIKAQLPRDALDAVIYDYQYNNRLLQTDEIITTNKPFYESKNNIDGTITICEVGNQIHRSTAYDAEGRPSMYISALGEKRYIKRDARGNIIAETDFPLLTQVDQPPQIPYIKHSINAHQQVTGTRKYATPAIQSDDANTDFPFYAVETPDKDMQSYVAMDTMGNPVATQTPSDHLQHVTYNKRKHPVRTYEFVSGYHLQKQDDGRGNITKKRVRIKHVQGTRQDYNNRGLCTMVEQYDGHRQIKTHKHYNAYNECVGEGSDDTQIILQQRFDKSGFKWYTNEDQGIPTITFPDINGKPIATYRSASMNLDNYKNNQADAKTQLLDKPYTETYKTIQRSVLSYDNESNVVTQQTPWYQTPSKSTRSHLPLTFNVIESNDKTHLTWEDAENILNPSFSLRRKGEEAWTSLSVMTGPDNNNYVDVSTLPTDHYEYKLFTNDQDTPQEIASGDCTLDTGNYQDTKELIWYLINDDTLILCGQMTDIAGIELIDANAQTKRLAATKLREGKLQIDLSKQVSGEYQFRLAHVIPDKQQMKLGDHDDYTIQVICPNYTYDNQSHSIASTGKDTPFSLSFPKKMTLTAPVYQQAAVSLPNWEYDFYHNKCHIYPSTPLPSATISGIDSRGDSYYLDHFVSHPGNNTIYKESSNYYRADVNSLLPQPGQSFAVFEGLAENEAYLADILIDNQPNGSLALQPWANGTQRLNLPQNGFWTAQGLRYLWKMNMDGYIQFNLKKIEPVPNASTLGTLNIRTTKPGHPLTAQEISVNNLRLRRFHVGAFFNDNWVLDKGHFDNYFRYEWRTNLSHPLKLKVKHNGLEQVIDNISTLPNDSTANPIHFQSCNKGIDESAGILSYSLLMDNGDEIPMAFEIKPEQTLAGDGQRYLISFLRVGDQKVRYLGVPIDETQYQDAHSLYFSPLPAGIAKIVFEYASPNSSREPEWIAVRQVTPTQQGMAMSLAAIPPGSYQYRFYALDAKGNKMDLNQNCGTAQDDWYYGSMQVKKGKAQTPSFTSQPQAKTLNLIKPVSSSVYDAWHNRIEETDRKGHTTKYEYNVFKQVIKTISDTTTNVDQHGIATREPLMTEIRNNKHGHTLAIIQPNGGAVKRMVNHRGSNLYHTDADYELKTATGVPIGLAHANTIDLFDRIIATKTSAGSKTLSTYSYQNGLTIEERSLSGGLTEIYENNEKDQCIQVIDSTKFINSYEKDSAGNEIFSINNKYCTRAQHVDMRTNQPILMRDEDGVLLKSEVDYFGNVLSHTDNSGQKITQTLNYNKQVVTAIGEFSASTPETKIDQAKDWSLTDPDQAEDNCQLLPRGRQTEDQNTPVYVPPKQIENIYNEAGHLVTIYDKAEQLISKKEYDENDYCDSYYFINHDGIIYQHVKIEHDELNRVTALYDTRLIIQIAYDKNSNRRFAKAYTPAHANETPSLTRESWHDYTLGNRVILRDCLSKEGIISLAPKQGMQITYEHGEVKSQTLINKKGKRETSKIAYKKDSFLLDTISTYEQEQNNPESLTTTVKRHYDDAQRCKRIEKIKKEKLGAGYRRTSTIDENTYDDHDHSIVQQTNQEDVVTLIYGMPMERTSTNTRTVVQKTNTQRPLVETNVYKGHLKDEKATPFEIHDTFTHHYVSGSDGINDQSVTVQREIQPSNIHSDQLPPPASSTTTQDANGHYTSYRRAHVPGANGDSYRSMVTTPEGNVVFKQTQAGRDYYLYAEKKPGKMVLFAYIGNIDDESNTSTATSVPEFIKLHAPYQALSAQFPPPAPMHYSVTREMTYRELAEELNYTGYETQIAEANNKDEDSLIYPGETVTIPPLSFEVPETAWNGASPSVDNILGSLYPNLTPPKLWVDPDKPKKRSWLETFVEVAAFTAIMYFVPGALMAAPQFSAFLAYATAGVAATTADQIIDSGFGSQDGYHIKAVIGGGLSAGVSGSLLQMNGMLNTSSSILQDFTNASLSTNIVVAEEVAIAQHALLLSTGIERQFDWRSLGVAAFNGAAGYGINQIPGSQSYAYVNAGLNTAIDGMGDSLLLNQSIHFADLSASVSGTMVGNYSVSLFQRHNEPSPAPEQKDNKDAFEHTQRQTRASRWNTPSHRSRPTLAQHSLLTDKKTYTDTYSDFENLPVHSATQTLLEAAQAAGNGDVYSFHDSATPLEKIAMISTAAILLPEEILAAVGYAATATITGPLAEVSLLSGPFNEPLLAGIGRTITASSVKLFDSLGWFSREVAGGESTAIRQRVLGNIAESRAARKASYFKVHTHVEDALTLDVGTELDAATFWSGKDNRLLAESYASNTGRTTLEMTSGGKYLDSLELFKTYPYEQAIRPWEVLSERFAQSASGRVSAFVENASTRSIFNRIENPALRANPNVTEIVFSPELEYANRFGRP